MPSAELRRAAAFLGSWELCFQEVTAAVGARSAAEFRTLAPGATAAIHEAERVFRTQADTTYSFDGPGLFAQPEPKRQHELMDLVHAHQRDRLLAALPDEDKVDIESVTGVGAGGSLQPPQGPEASLFGPGGRFRKSFGNRSTAWVITSRMETIPTSVSPSTTGT